LILSYLHQLSYLESCLAGIQYLPAHEKDQVQDFRNWASSGSEGTSRSAPESPVIGLIETPATNLPNIDTAEKSSEPSPEHTPAAAEGASNAGGSGSNEAEGSKGPAIRLVPFQSMPQTTKEELGNELFDDPLLSLDNMKKLADCMQWSFKFTKVSLLPLLVFVE
jgi:hypothetical protein